MSELLPEPAAPVTMVRTPVGISTLTFLRLLMFALRTESLPAGLRRQDGLALMRAALRQSLGRNGV